MLKDTIIASLVAFAISAIICPLGIPVLHKLKFGQYIREEGPEGHKKKSGTPTMGGIMFMIAIMIASAFYMKKYPMIIPVLLFMILFGLIGFADDWLKVAKKQNEGLKAWQKLAMQFVVTLAFAIYLYNLPQVGTEMLVPFTGGFKDGVVVRLGIFFIPVVFIVVLGTDNGVNFTDGLDGLCSSVTVAVAVFFAAVCIKENIPLAPIAGIVAGALVGFLLYNVHPAKIFMGDTGSLALGGFVSSYALITRLPLFIIIAGFIYLAEVVSVILQVSYFKITHGKRLFRMSPIHHHFELGGWSETRVVAVFTTVTCVLCMLCFLGLR